VNRFIGYSLVVTANNYDIVKITVTVAHKVFNICEQFTAESSQLLSMKASCPRLNGFSAATDGLIHNSCVKQLLGILLLQETQIEMSISKVSSPAFACFVLTAPAALW
jgi:hypothetical protein